MDITTNLLFQSLPNVRYSDINYIHGVCNHRSPRLWLQIDLVSILVLLLQLCGLLCEVLLTHLEIGNSRGHLKSHRED